MPHKPRTLTTLALAIFLVMDSNAQETLEPYAPPILHRGNEQS